MGKIVGRSGGYEEPQKIWNAQFIRALGANAMMYAAIMMVNVLIAKYSQTLTDSSALIGLATGVFSITALIMKLIAAPVLDAFDKRYILAVSLAVMAAAIFGYSFSGTLSMVIAFRMLQGVGLAFSTTCFLTVAADALPQKQIATGIGYFTLAQAMCQAFGPNVGLMLVDAVGYQATFLIAFAIMLCSSLFALTLQTKTTERKQFAFSFKNVVAKEAVLPAILIFILTLTYYTVNSFLVIYAEGKSVNNIGLFFTVYALTLLVARPLVGKLADRFGMVRTLVPTIFLFAVSFWITEAANSLPAFLFAGFIQAMGYGVAFSLVNAYLMKSVPPDRRGVASCTGYIGNDLGTLAGPILSGTVADAAGYGRMWGIMTIPMFLAIVLIFVKRKDIDRTCNSET